RENRSLSGLLSAIAGGSPIVSGWRASLDEILTEEFGEDEAVKFGLAANLSYYSADPARLWWLFFAVAQGGYLASGGVYVHGGSRQLSIKLASAIKRAGGTVLLGTGAASIEVGGEGAAAGIVTMVRGERLPQRIEAGVILANCGPAAISRMLPDDVRSRFASAFAGREPSTSLFSAHFGLKINPAQFGLTAYSVVLLPP